MEYIDQSLELQREFFKNNRLDPDFRLANLKKLKGLIEDYEEELLEALALDLNKSAFEGYTTELALVLEEIKLAIKNIHKWTRPRRVRTNLINFKSRSYIMSEAYGNCLIMSPWNYPVLLTLAPLVAAMASGNTVILKPSENSPHSSRVLEELINNNFPRSYVHLINGGIETSQYIIRQKFDYIFYTGGVEVGRLVMQEAAKNLTPLSLELGGKSPAIVQGSAKLDLAAKRIVWGKFLNSGQTCVAPDYLLVEESIKEDFVDKLIYYIDEMILKDSLDYPKIINRKHFHRLQSYKKDVDILRDWGYDEDKLKIYPCLVDIHEDQLDLALMKEEIFGPILPILTFKEDHEVFDFLLEREKPLALYVFSEDRPFINRVLEDLSFGGGAINDTVMQISNPYLPFGGVGQSGMGNYHGIHGFKSFSHEKSILDKSSLIDISLRYPPYGKKLKWVKKILR